MITSTRVLVTDCTNPHHNLAFEDALLTSSPPGQATLFLWQNKHTVVIGAGQNAWRECHTRLLEAERGTLARRTTGGGAVYHDMGNLNFSFVVPREDYDVERQLSVVIHAVRAFGIDARASGRNDVTAGGRKFSGNAFRLLKHAALHHGTLLVSADMARIGRYLNVAPDKLKAKGVKSVPSRVMNLSELGAVDIEGMKRAMAGAFMRVYGACALTRAEDAGIDASALIEKYSSWAWNYGASPVGEMRLETRFPWGAIELFADVRGGAVERAQVYTDSMDETLKPRLEAALHGCAWRGEALAERLAAIGEGDIAAWLEDI